MLVSYPIKYSKRQRSCICTHGRELKTTAFSNDYNGHFILSFKGMITFIIVRFFFYLSEINDLFAIYVNKLFSHENNLFCFFRVKGMNSK